MGDATLTDAEVLLAGLLELVNVLPDDTLRMLRGPGGTIIVETAIPCLLMDEAIARLRARDKANEESDDAAEEARA